MGNTKMIMTDEELKRNMSQALHPFKQVKVLAELNDVPVGEMKEKLRKLGAMPQKKTSKKTEPKEEPEPAAEEEKAIDRSCSNQEAPGTVTGAETEEPIDKRVKLISFIEENDLSYCLGQAVAHIIAYADAPESDGSHLEEAVWFIKHHVRTKR